MLSDRVGSELYANAANQRYWVYFRPQPTGLDAASVAELKRMLRVRVCTRDGKELAVPVEIAKLRDEERVAANVGEEPEVTGSSWLIRRTSVDLPAPE